MIAVIRILSFLGGLAFIGLVLWLIADRVIFRQRRRDRRDRLTAQFEERQAEYLAEEERRTRQRLRDNMDRMDRGEL